MVNCKKNVYGKMPKKVFKVKCKKSVYGKLQKSVYGRMQK